MERHASRTNLIGASIAVVGRYIGVFGATRDTADAIAFILLAIARHAIVDERACGCILYAACPSVACLRLACRIRAAIGRYRAPDAKPRAIANQIHVDPARYARGGIRGRKHSIGTSFERAFQPVVGHVLIVRHQKVFARDTQRRIAIAWFVRDPRGRKAIERHILARAVVACVGRASILIVACLVGSTARRASGTAHSGSASHSTYAAASRIAAAARRTR